MTSTRLDPLAWNVPIVNKDGTPTREFMRKWAQQRTANSSIPVSAAQVQELLDLIGSTRGSIFIRGATGWTLLAPGSTGQVVTSNGPGADPSYATPTAGGAVYSSLFTDTAGDTFAAMVNSEADPEYVTDASGVPIYTKGLTASKVRGVTDGSDAAAGFVGEYQSANIPPGSAITLATAVTTEIVSLTLTPGDWDISGYASFNLSGGATATHLAAAIYTTSGGLPATPTAFPFSALEATATSGVRMTVGTGRLSVSIVTTIYLNVEAFFTGGTVVSHGQINARRVR